MSSDKRLRIVHLIETLSPGGAERLLHTNLKHLDKERFSHTVLTVFARNEHWRAPLESLGARVASLNCHGYRDALSGVRRMRGWLRRERPHLLHTHLWAANVIGRIAGRLTGVPVVSSIHGADYEPEAWADGSEVSGWKRLGVRELDSWTARFGCERMVAVSEYVRQSIHRHLGFPLKRIELIYNPIDVEELARPPARSRAEILRDLGWPEESFILLNVGHVAPQKGLLYALRALPLVRKKFPAARLISLGGMDDRNWVMRLEAEAKSLGISESLRFMGARRDVPDFLRACDLFVFPSLHEGLGIALIEAMAAGRACVAAETGPLPEIVRHGTDGLLTPPRDPAALAEALISLLENPERRAALGRAAQETARARFQPQLAAEKLSALYEELAANGNANRSASAPVSSAAA